MRILALNCGSSSLKCAVIDPASPAPRMEVRVERPLEGKAQTQASIDAALAELRGLELGELDAVVHRVVHGGERFTEPVIVDDAVLQELVELEPLAPLHNPPAIHAIRRARESFGSIPHVAVFDTAFHATLPPQAREYALPAELRSRFGIRRFGFHGISHGSVAPRVGELLRRDPRDLRLISCHLGNGASITAIDGGLSVDTSMGMTPLEGLVMGTRAGDLDPGALLALARRMTPEELDELLNEKSGLKCLTGTADMRAIEHRATQGDAKCTFALALYVHRIRKYLGGYAAVLGGVDAIVFTGGVGEKSALVRQQAVETLGFIGVDLDDARNREARVDATHPAVDLAVPGARVRVIVLRADEESAMAAAAASLLGSAPAQ
jgi:acetate kinase